MAVEQFGERGVVELVGIMGYYALISATLNVFEVPVPAGSPLPLRD
jgi:4-carboxymuconolactone decarboxylase